MQTVDLDVAGMGLTAPLASPGQPAGSVRFLIEVARSPNGLLAFRPTRPFGAHVVDHQRSGSVCGVELISQRLSLAEDLGRVLGSCE